MESLDPNPMMIGTVEAFGIAYLVVGLIMAEAANKRQMIHASGVLRLGIYSALVLAWLPLLSWLAISPHTKESDS